MRDRFSHAHLAVGVRLAFRRRLPFEPHNELCALGGVLQLGDDGDFGLVFRQDPGADSEIADVAWGHGEEGHGPVDAAQQEEVTRVAVHALGVLHDAQGEEVALPELDRGSELGLPGGPAAFVVVGPAPTAFIGGDRLAVAPDLTAVLHAIEVDLYLAALPLGRAL